MMKCPSCGTENLAGSQYCDECGAKLQVSANNGPGPSDFRPQNTSSSRISGAHATSVGIPPLVESVDASYQPSPFNEAKDLRGAHSRLVIERGESADTEFSLSAEEAYIGRWDADNGIFPDVDLDAHDPDAKVSRKHARIIYRNNIFMIEDLGSTNGTFVNRGRRLLPGSPQVLSEGDEIIVGKTFLRFCINR